MAAGSQGDRLKSLRRIEAVQAQMVTLAQWRIAAAERRLAEVGEDRTRMRAYVEAPGGLGVTLAKAAHRTMEALERRAKMAEQEHAAETTRLDALRRRGRAVDTMVERTADAARREVEERDLRDTMEAWLAGQG